MTETSEQRQLCPACKTKQTEVFGLPCHHNQGCHACFALQPLSPLCVVCKQGVMHYESTTQSDWKMCPSEKKDEHEEGHEEEDQEDDFVEEADLLDEKKKLQLDDGNAGEEYIEDICEKDEMELEELDQVHDDVRKKHRKLDKDEFSMMDADLRNERQCVEEWRPENKIKYEEEEEDEEEEEEEDDEEESDEETSEYEEEEDEEEEDQEDDEPPPKKRQKKATSSSISNTPTTANLPTTTTTISVTTVPPKKKHSPYKISEKALQELQKEAQMVTGKRKRNSK